MLILHRISCQLFPSTEWFHGYTFDSIRTNCLGKSHLRPSETSFSSSFWTMQLFHHFPITLHPNSTTHNRYLTSASLCSSFSLPGEGRYRCSSFRAPGCMRLAPLSLLQGEEESISSVFRHIHDTDVINSLPTIQPRDGWSMNTCEERCQFSLEGTQRLPRTERNRSFLMKWIDSPMSSCSNCTFLVWFDIYSQCC